ncbi:flagellar biosynthesis anti-sigma factor FlgM [Parendozoicomonas haliclonae]|uniref:Negative regulator of flagellin synthesis n=1 Tax=Parendozoicomonas haliclonae TaxID=1960125 RepID=A0A1X7ANH6_9GAMM|nr:flagellar biosynthesis anti-sigma factor FlgM [Parendozoicomonas haliclonae]SMA49648.1 anti-sigma28 factor FlgM [Parendozoicomonas haliclonae]
MSASRITGTVTDMVVARTRKIQERDAQVSEQSPKQDTLSISQDAALLQQAEAIAASTPDIDMAKVEQVRQAIARGELKIDYEKLAQKMLDFEGALDAALDPSSES